VAYQIIGNYTQLLTYKIYVSTHSEPSCQRFTEFAKEGISDQLPNTVLTTTQVTKSVFTLGGH